MTKHSTRVILSRLSGKKPFEGTDIIKEPVNSVQSSKSQSFPPVAEYGNALNYILGPTLSDEPSPMDK